MREGMGVREQTSLSGRAHIKSLVQPLKEQLKYETL